MNEQQAKQILNRLAVLFPDWIDWVVSLQTREQTQAAWIAALTTQEVGDCEQVISDWQTGRKTAPAMYERERYIYLLVEASRQLKQVRVSKEEPQQTQEMYREIKQLKAEAKERRENYKPIGWLGAIYRRFEDKAALVKAGTLSHEDYMRYVDSVVAEERERNANL